MGASSLGLRTTVFPAASGAATARTPRMTGAFQGANAATTPSGSRAASPSAPSCWEVRTSPRGAVTAAAASRRICAARVTLKPARGRVAPTSRAMTSATRSARASSTSAARRKTARRSKGLSAAQVPNAASAAATARSTKTSPCEHTQT